MVENNVNEGNIEANSSNAPEEVTVTENELIAAGLDTQAEVAGQAAEEMVEIVEAEAPPVIQVDPEEKFISDLLESGKTEISTTELVIAGFNMMPMDKQYSFRVGKFKLTRLFLTDPYKIER